MVTKTDRENMGVPMNVKGFVNIGSHPKNDVVINDEGVQPFHALLDCRTEPYTLVPLSPDTAITLNGMTLPEHEVFQIQAGDTVGLGNHRLRVMPTVNGTLPRLALASGQNEAENIPTFQALGAADHLPETAQDDIILASLDKTACEIVVEQTAVFVLTLGNGSPIVSTFHVRVEGVPDEWVMVSPDNVNLNESARGTVTVEITPPRQSESTAGEHFVRFVITSHNHPDRRVTLSAALTIAPYYDYVISDLSPKKRRIGWGQKTGQVVMNVTNRGNNLSSFLLTAQDEENGCRFQFVDSSGLKQPNQAQYTVPPGETYPVELHIAPIKRSLIRFRAQVFPYRVVSSQPENPALSLFTTGSTISGPLINAMGLLLIMLVLAGITGYLFTPRVSAFTADNNLIGVGESTTLRWKTSPFTHNLQITGIDKVISGSQGAIQVFPATTVNTYTLSATTWLWSLLSLTPKTIPVTILAVPGEPVVSTFTVSTDEALVGDEVTLRWSVENTDKLFLTINGVTETFEDKKDFNGERKLPIEKATLISLVAQNTSGSVVRSKFIKVQQPSIVIEKFELSKSTITTGDQVTIKWKVSGVGMANGGEVTISAFDSVLPLEGQMTFFPKESMEFVLTARNRKLQESRILPVGVLPPGTPPSPPTIDFFTAAPDKLTGSGSAELAWSVSGSYDKISISNGSQVIADNLSAQGFRSISVSTSGTYVLTATYSGKSAGANLKITVDPALIKPNLSITSVYPEDDLQMGDTALVTVSITNPLATDPPVTGKIIVTDGTSSCIIELPKTNCDLEFETPGNKTLTASYQGDSLHVQTVSGSYPKTLKVQGNTITLGVIVIPTTPLYRYNQAVTLNITVNGTNPSRVPDGELRIRRICDATAKYAGACTDDTIAYHKLTSGDSGAYKFTNLAIDQLGATWNLQITFTGDSFYSNATQSAALKIDSTTSPVTVTAVTTDPLPGLAGSDLNYAITVKDQNTAGIYVVPGGTITATALHSDGVTQATCTNLILVPNGDGRSANAACALTMTKSGSWTLTVQYEAADSDIIHPDTSNTYPNIVINSDVLATVTSAPTAAPYAIQRSIDLTLFRSEDPTAVVTTGTLACSWPAGSSDGACSCSHTSGAAWRCNFTASPTDTLPTTKIITMIYTPANGSYLNNQSLTHSLTIEKAATNTTLIDQPVATYPIDGVYSFNITVAHANGGPAPTAGTVTAYLGTGICGATTGMASGVLDTLTVDINTQLSFTFAARHRAGTLSVCYRYNGDSASYAASSYQQTSPFNVVASGTVAAISTQPATTYNVGGAFAITVTASRTSGTAPVTAGNVSIQLGTGTCSSSSGLTGGTVLSTYSNTVGAATTITFKASHVVGQDIRFCVRYEGDGSMLNASPWVASNPLRVKAVPTWGATQPVELVASESSNVFTQFSVVLNNAYQPVSNHVKILLASDSTTVVCPSSGAAQPVCSFVSSATNGSATTFTFKVATNIGTSLANAWSVIPKYFDTAGASVDQNNNEATGAAFTIHPYYHLIYTAVASTVGCPTCADRLLYAYNSYEIATNEVMQTVVSEQFSVDNFSNFDYETAGFTGTIKGETNSGTIVDVTHISGDCTITNQVVGSKREGMVNCPAVGVTDSMVNSFRITLIPSEPTQYSANLSGAAAYVDVIQNVIEEANDPYFGIKVTNMGCSGSDGKRQDFQVDGYASGTGNPLNPLVPSDLIFGLQCEDANDGNNDWDADMDYHYTSANSTFSELFTWTQVGDVWKFSFTVHANNKSVPGYSGCSAGSDGVRFTLENPHSNSPGLDYKDFEFFSWDTHDLYLNDDSGGGPSDVNYDECKDK